jgi:hypothetical protein
MVLLPVGNMNEQAKVGPGGCTAVTQLSFLLLLLPLSLPLSLSLLP